MPAPFLNTNNYLMGGRESFSYKMVTSFFFHLALHLISFWLAFASSGTLLPAFCNWHTLPFKVPLTIYRRVSLFLWDRRLAAVECRSAGGEAGRDRSPPLVRSPPPKCAEGGVCCMKAAGIWQAYSSPWHSRDTQIKLYVPQQDTGMASNLDFPHTQDTLLPSKKQ